MHSGPMCWDYLILTASNERQASAYEGQLRLRAGTGQLPQVREWLVVADLEGRRIGSGASTLDCLLRVVNAERRKREGAPEALAETLGRLRILIIHAGGDSRRLPAYGPAGKIFVPVPGESRGAAPLTLFDLLAPAFLELPSTGRGQLVVTAGDALNRFDASQVNWDADGMTILGCLAAPEEAARHGVFCAGERGGLRLYLQKPSTAVQQATGAMNAEGQTVLDIGVMSCDAPAAAALLQAFAVKEESGGELGWAPDMRSRVLSLGMDLYREICCALGTEATLDHYVQCARASGSAWEDGMFAAAFPALRSIPVHVGVVPAAGFLHFGSTRQLISSGVALTGRPGEYVPVNNELGAGGRIEGGDAWVEGCRIGAPLTLAGRNAAIGLDVDDPLSLSEGACLEVLAGRARDGEAAWFVRCYGIDDSFKDGRYCGLPLPEWCGASGTLWDAAMFPAEKHPGGYRRWLWMFDMERATPEQKAQWLAADRYSAAEIALAADQEAFHWRRSEIHLH